MSGLSDPVFERIARRYDRINKVLSAGHDGEWRRLAAEQLPHGTILDLGAGTGAAAEVLGDRRVVALDPVAAMLALNPAPDRVVAIGEGLPFADESFDGVFSAYVLRNLSSVSATLGEMARVLRPGGVAVIVDLARPRSPVARLVHRLGTAVTLPTVGLVMARAPGEYWYLHRSLDRYSPPEIMFHGGELVHERLWRMGPMGFVYAVVLAKKD